MASLEPQTEANDPTPAAATPSRWDLTALSQLPFNDLLYHVLFGDRQSSALEPNEA